MCIAILICSYFALTHMHNEYTYRYNIPKYVNPNKVNKYACNSFKKYFVYFFALQYKKFYSSIYTETLLNDEKTY